MLAISYWNNWPKVYKGLFQILVLLFASSLVFAIASFIWNPSPVFTWQQVQEMNQQRLPVYEFEVGGFDITVSSINYILFERWAANPMAIHMQPLDFYLVIFCMSMVVLLSIVTVLPRFWFYVAAGTLVLIVSSFQLETLRIFGFENKIPTVAAILLLLSLSLYFQFFNSTATIIHRLLAFAAALIVLVITINKFSHIAHPLRYFAINTLPFSIVLTLLFVIIVAHEIVASFISLVGQGTRNTKSLTHLLVISAIYFLNLWLTYLARIGSLDWGLTIPPFLLLIVSAVLSIWGIHQRRVLYEGILPADYFAVFMILALGAISFGCAGYFFAAADDISIVSLNDLVLFAHIGYGMMFLAYVASNFLGMIAANLPVHRIIYRPTNMPYFSYRLAGLIFTLAFVFYNRWMVPVNHFISGYYTSAGDLFASADDMNLAAVYYKRAHFFAPYNQHSATALAALERMRGNSFKEREYLEDANDFKPTEFTLLNEANTFYFNGNSLYEFLTLQKANRVLPKSGVVKNNLGLSYAKLGMIDSAYFYLTQAAKVKQSQSSAEMNLFGLVVANQLPVDEEAVSQFYSDHLGATGNALAIANHRKKVVDFNFTFPKDSVLNLFSATLLANLITNHVSNSDTAFLSSAVKVARKDENSDYHEIILVPTAMAYYAAGQVTTAFSLLQEVIFRGRNQDMHNTTMALWALDQDKPEVALIFWQYVTAQTTSAVANAVTLTEAGKLNEAIVAWDTLGSKRDTALHAMAESMKRVLAAPESWFDDLTQKEKYQYLRHRVSPEDPAFDRLLGSITNEDLKAKAILDRAKKMFGQDEVAKAATVFRQLQGLHLTDTHLFSEIMYFELELFARQSNWTALEEQIKKGVTFGPYRATERVYYDALLQLNAGDTAAASRGFDWIATNNPYFDEGVVRSAAFFQTHGNEKLKPYRLLSEALQVNPSSVKILKAYIPEALKNSFDEYAASALQTLKGLISAAAFAKFVEENQLTPLLLQ